MGAMTAKAIPSAVAVAIKVNNWFTQSTEQKSQSWRSRKRTSWFMLDCIFQNCDELRLNNFQAIAFFKVKKT